MTIMTLEVIGNLILCAMIIAAPIIFIVANINYVEEKEGEDNNKKDKESS